MAKRTIYGTFIVSIIFVLASCGSNRIELPPLEETFSQKDKDPFGAYVAHRQLGQWYFHNSIHVVNDNFDKTWRDISDTASLYINISKNLFLTKADLTGMMEFVTNGNSLFISSENIDRRLLDTLGFAVSKEHENGSFSPVLSYTVVKLSPDVFYDTVGYRYFYLPFYNHFTKMGHPHTRVLGSNIAGANYVVVFYGKGRFYLHLEPRALSNYFLLQKDNYKYFQHLFSLTASIPEHVYWDNYYHKKNFPREESGGQSGLSVLLKYPALAWGFWLLLLLFCLYIFFGGKRRQRIVPTLAPNTNTTLAFTETIGRLYLQQKDNRNIADKQITYLFEHIRNQYYLNTTHTNDEFISTLSRKSGNTKEGTEKLFKSIHLVQQSMEVSDQQLLSLNQQVENFYKNKL